MPSLVVVPRSRSWSMPASLAAPARSRGSMLHSSSASVLRFEKSNTQWFSIELTKINNEVNPIIMRVSPFVRLLAGCVTWIRCDLPKVRELISSLLDATNGINSIFPIWIKAFERIRNIPFVPFFRSRISLRQESTERFDAYIFILPRWIIRVYIWSSDEVYEAFLSASLIRD